MHLNRSEHLRTFGIDSFTDSPGLTEQLAAVQGIRLDSWNPPSIREAMTVPAVFRAVSLIANTVGMLLMQAYRDSRLMAEQPILVTRPGLIGTPRVFWRDWAYGLATRGEKVIRIVDRDADGKPRKLMLLPGREVTVEWDPKLPWEKRYRWRNMPIPASDIHHSTFLEDEWALRGMGPLQLCGAALSAAVEAETWAARFFAEGGAPATVGKVPSRLTKDEAKRLRDQYLDPEGDGTGRGNSFRVADSGMDIEAHQVNPEAAQLVESRKHSASSVATMFGMNAHLLNVSEAGSSLTYQNVGEVFTDFVRSSLAPNYLVPIEEGISDMLPRSTVARFNVSELYRADLKTRADVFSTLITAGMPDPEARETSGFDQSAELAPIPAQDDPLPITRTEVPSA